MKTKFKIFALIEERVMTSAWLEHDGLKSETTLIVMRKHIADCNTYIEAFEFVGEQVDKPEHGYEILEVLINE